MGELQLIAGGLPPTRKSWKPGQLSAGLSYEWRIDGRDSTGVTEGDVWKFEVSPTGLAARAHSLSPAHLRVGVPDGLLLQWKSGAKALSHDVYFGTSFPLPFQRNQTNTWWAPGPLIRGQVYYWRIDEVSEAGTRTGWTMRFTR